MALWAAGLSGAVEPPALLTLDTACVYLKGGLCGVWRTSREGGGALGVKRRKTGGGGKASLGEVINIQQLRRSYYPVTSPPLPPLLCVLFMPESRWNVSAQGGGSSLVLSN